MRVSSPAAARCNAEEEAALVAVSNLVERLESCGMTAMMDVGAAQEESFCSALRTLASPPLNSVLVELLIQKAWCAFVPSLHRYQKLMTTSGMDGGFVLRQLYEDFSVVQSHVVEWCEQLGVPVMAELFPVHLRCAMLQPDLLTGEEPPAKPELMRYLRLHAKSMLSNRSTVLKGEWDYRNEVERCDLDGPRAQRAGCVTPPMFDVPGSADDATLQSVHGLTLYGAPEVKALWKLVIVASIQEKLDTLEGSFSEHYIQQYLAWYERVVEPYVYCILPTDSSGHTNMASARVERDRWCSELKQNLLMGFARRRIESFWNILVDYPDSIPALEDVQFCLQACHGMTLREELIDRLRSLLASRLQHGGTRTEDVLVMLFKTIHSLCVLLSKNEQSSVTFSVISDTLAHVRKRKDCVPAVVHAIISGESGFYADLPSGDGNQGAKQEAAPGTSDSPLRNEQQGNDAALWTELTRSAVYDDSRDQPDVLRVLLSAIPMKSLVQEYKRVLAQQLLSKEMYDYDTTSEEEVLERMKCIFGEDALSACVVMVRDFHMSRRLTHQLKDVLQQQRIREDGAPHLPKNDKPGNGTLLSIKERCASVLSMSVWPKLHHCLVARHTAPLPEKYIPHPLLQREMDTLAAAYKEIKTNQKLVWLLTQGRVTLELHQRDPDRGNVRVPVSYTMSLFGASVVLYVRELGAEDPEGASLCTIAGLMEVMPDVLRSQLTSLIPSALVLSQSGAALTIQKSVVRASMFVFEEAEEEEEKPVGLDPTQTSILLRMITAMLKTRGPQTVGDIHNSMKMFGQFTGTVTEMKKLLQIFVSQGLILLADNKMYAIPSK